MPSREWVLLPRDWRPWETAVGQKAGRRPLSASPGERPRKEPALPAPWSQTSRLRDFCSWSLEASGWLHLVMRPEPAETGLRRAAAPRREPLCPLYTNSSQQVTVPHRRKGWAPWH